MSGAEPVRSLSSDLVSMIDELTMLGVEKLPAERDLAETLHVSRSVLRRVLDDLERTGAILRIKGRAGGAYIRAVVESAPLSSTLFDATTRKVERSLNTIKGVPQMLQEQGFAPGTAVISELIEPASHGIAQALGISPGTPVVSLLRLRTSDGRPLSLERIHLVASRFPGLLEHAPIDSLYDLLQQQYDVRIAEVDELIEVVIAGRQISELLQLRPGTPVMVLRRVGRLHDGTPVEASIDIFRTDMMRLAVRTVIDHG